MVRFSAVVLGLWSSLLPVVAFVLPTRQQRSLASTAIGPLYEKLPPKKSPKSASGGGKPKQQGGGAKKQYPNSQNSPKGGGKNFGGGATFKNTSKGAGGGGGNFKNASKGTSAYTLNAKTSKSGPAQAGGGEGGGGFSLRMVYSKYDMQDDPDEYDENEIVKFKNGATMKDVERALNENFGLDGDDMATLECYVNGQWKTFKDTAALKGQKGVTMIRDTEAFDDGLGDYGYDFRKDTGRFLEADDFDNDDIDDDEFDDDNKIYGGDGDDDDDDDFGDGMIGSSSLGRQIRDMVIDLQEKEYSHSAATMQLIAKTGEIISTKDYIMDQAMNDVPLQEALVGKVGYLDHMVQCIHFPFLWNNETTNEKR